MKSIKIRNESVVPIAGQVAVILSISLIGYFKFIRPMQSLGVYIIMLFITVSFLLLIVIFTTRNILRLDLSNKKIEEYVLLMGYRFGSSRSYDGIEKIFINRSVMVQKNQYVRWITVSNVDSDTIYRGYLYKSFMKFNDGSKLFLKADYNKSKLVAELNKINYLVKTTIQDYT